MSQGGGVAVGGTAVLVLVGIGVVVETIEVRLAVTMGGTVDVDRAIVAVGLGVTQPFV
jgi:hypothetical protein